MGTSKSQPSPSGNSEAGKAWAAVGETFKYEANPETALSTILKAYQGEFRASTLTTLVDDGVKIVEECVRTQPAANAADPATSIANYFVDARTRLAQAGKNSFLAELALVCGAEAVRAPANERNVSFQSSYLAKLVEYVVSRDFPKLFGNPGLVNNRSLEIFVRDAKASIRAGLERGESLEVILARKLERLGE